MECGNLQKIEQVELSTKAWSHKVCQGREKSQSEGGVARRNGLLPKAEDGGSWLTRWWVSFDFNHRVLEEITDDFQYSQSIPYEKLLGKQDFTKWINQIIGSLETRKLFICSLAKSCLMLCSPRTAACQAPLSFSISWSLLKFMSH